jgi:hypothetical protein
MNYKKTYDALIQRAIGRFLTGYLESHHIIPKCMGGTNDSNNLVHLTPEEHYVAHLLLVKMYPKNKKLIFAANMMANRNNKAYGWIKRKFSIEISRQNKGKSLNLTDEQKKIRSSKQKGRKKSNDWKKKVSIAHTKTIEYKGLLYLGYDELFKSTGISRHLYTKYYLKGQDPTPFVKNNIHGLLKKAQTCPSKSSLGKKWYNNNIIERYFKPGTQPSGWVCGRLKNNV